MNQSLSRLTTCRIRDLWPEEERFSDWLAEDENFSLVHCHTPLGGVLGRLAFRNTSAKIIYTAHGFHFYQGAPILNWLIYYPIEKILAKYTDVLITINKEDYERAKKHYLL